MGASIKINKLIIGEIRFLFWRILWMEMFVQKLLLMSKLMHSTGRAGGAGKKDFSASNRIVLNYHLFGGFVA